MAKTISFPGGRKWETYDETTFLQHIGEFGINGKTCTPERKCKLLEGYLRAARHRKNWGKVDRKIAIATAEGLLETILRKTAN